MRLNSESIIKGVGYVSMTPDTIDDLWLLYNLICVGDLVRCSTLRKLQFGYKGETERMRLTLQVRVLHLVFDPDHGEIRVTGVNITESEFVKQGAHHALEVVLHQPVSLEKDAWAAVDVASVRSAAGRGFSGGGGGGGGSSGEGGGGGAPDLIAVMLEEGRAEVCSLSRGLTLVKSRVDAPIPPKRAGGGSSSSSSGGGGGAKREAALARFFDALLSAVLRAADWEGAPPRALLLASPGFSRDAFRAHLAAACAAHVDCKALGRVRVVCAPAPAGAKWALGAALADPVVAALLEGSAAVGEVALLERFHATLAKTPPLAQYGWRHVSAAVEVGAVECLLVCDRLVREAARGGGRGAVAALVAAAAQAGAAGTTVSSMHVSGEALWGLGGLAAILRYEVPDIDEAAEGMPKGPVEAAAAASAAGAGGARAADAAAGKRLQQQTAPPPPVAPEVAAGDRFGVAFDIDSDKSEDSDVEVERGGGK